MPSRIAYAEDVVGCGTISIEHIGITHMKQIVAMIIAALVLAGCGAGNAIESAGSSWSKDMWRDNDRSAPGGS